jgi:hypothetical protein
MVKRKIYMKYLLEYKIFESIGLFDIKNDIGLAINDKWLSLQESNYESEILDMYNTETGEDLEEITQEVRAWLKLELEDRAIEALNNIEARIDNQKLRIWREITVADNYESHLISQAKRIGIYWSWDEGRAEAHWGYSNDLKRIAKIEALVGLESIDWVSTVQANSDIFLFEEREITLVKGVPITIESIRVDGRDISLSTIKNKQFIA